MRFEKRKICSCSPIKQIKFELRTIDKKKMLIGVCAVVVSGIISRIWGGQARYPLNSYMPRFMPSLFWLTLGQIVTCILYGAVLGAVISCEERCKRDCRNQGILHLVIVVVFSFTWHPLFFGAYAYFAAVIAVIAMCVFCFFAMINVMKVYLVCGCALAVQLVILCYFLIENVAYLLIN